MKVRRLQVFKVGDLIPEGSNFLKSERVFRPELDTCTDCFYFLCPVDKEDALEIGEEAPDHEAEALKSFLETENMNV